MATLPQANKAREVHSNFLRKVGAHSIGVDEIKIKGKKTFAVIAHLEQTRKPLPEFLEIEWKDEVKKVPLVTKISGMFKPETLV
jgi:hypothetical protein